MIYRTVNLESGMPTVRECIERLENELKRSKEYGVKVLKIIHGYGSSGKGGRLRIELRSDLAMRKESGKIKDIIFGEDFSIFNESTRKIIHLDREIKEDRDLERHNNGITLIIL